MITSLTDAQRGEVPRVCAALDRDRPQLRANLRKPLVICDRQWAVRIDRPSGPTLAFSGVGTSYALFPKRKDAKAFRDNLAKHIANPCSVIEVMASFEEFK